MCGGGVTDLGHSPIFHFFLSLFNDDDDDDENPIQASYTFGQASVYMYTASALNQSMSKS